MAKTTRSGQADASGRAIKKALGPADKRNLAAETGRFVIRCGLAGEARMMASFGFFQLLSDYCMDTDTNDVFGITHMGIVEKYEMDLIRQIGEPFRYPTPSTMRCLYPSIVISERRTRSIWDAPLAIHSRGETYPAV